MSWYQYKINDSHMGCPHRVDALREGVAVGFIEWSRRSGLILNLHVDEEVRRQGIGTALLAEARRLARETRGMMMPRINPERTDDGEAFVRSLSERVPRRKNRRIP